MKASNIVSITTQQTIENKLVRMKELSDSIKVLEAE